LILDKGKYHYVTQHVVSGDEESKLLYSRYGFIRFSECDNYLHFFSAALQNLRVVNADKLDFPLNVSGHICRGFVLLFPLYKVL
jgi:hypothetical protein